MSEQRILWYFADPMCSWCYGFSPVIAGIETTYGDRFKLELMMGGLRPGGTEPVTPAFRDEILHHWQEVHRRTGQPFAFDGAMPDGFIYNTEPPSRGVIAVGELNPAMMFPYFKSLQHAFYAAQQDVTQPKILAALAQRQHIEPEKFLERFHSDEVNQKTQMHFQATQQSGITGFPTIVLQDVTGVRLLTAGYQPYENLKTEVEAWLDSRAPAARER